MTKKGKRPSWKPIVKHTQKHAGIWYPIHQWWTIPNTTLSSRINRNIMQATEGLHAESVNNTLLVSWPPQEGETPNLEAAQADIENQPHTMGDPQQHSGHSAPGYQWPYIAAAVKKQPGTWFKVNYWGDAKTAAVASAIRKNHIHPMRGMDAKSRMHELYVRWPKQGKDTQNG